MRPSLPVTAVLRAALAVLLLAGFYLLGLGLLAALAWLSGWLWLVSPGPVAGEFGFLTAALGLGLAVPVWQVFRARPEPPAGAAVTEQQAPELWAQVRELAGAVGTRAPDEIRLWCEANAGVWGDTRWFGLHGGRRILYLGVPLLQVLPVAQLRAVLAHELGHYSRHHTRLGVVTYRGGQAIVHTLLRIGPDRFAGMLLGGYALLYFLVSLSVLRRMELAADRTAVQVTGREVFGSALQETDRVNHAWAYLLASYVAWARTDGYQPSKLLDWFGTLMAERPDELDRRRRDPAPDWWYHWDPHPPVEHRVARVATEPEPQPAPLPDHRPAAVLVPDPQQLAGALWTSDFDQAVARVAQVEAERDAGWLYPATARVLAHDYRHHRCRLGCVLDLLAAGRADELQRALPVPDLAGLVEVVLAAASATVVTAEGAQWRHEPGRPITLARKRMPIELRSYVTRACHNPDAAATLRARLRELGVGSAVVTRQPQAWKAPLQLRPAYRTTHPRSTDLLLPEELFLLGYSPSGDRRLDTDVFEAALGAAVLAELRLRGRIRLAPYETATVYVDDPAPTGEPLLDPVLERIAGARPMPAYQWLPRLGAGVSGQVAERLLGADGRLDYGQAWEIARLARTGIAGALQANDDPGGRDLMLGKLLWGCELTAPVLGRSAFGTRFWLGRLAARDPLAVAIRVVIGMHMPLPSGGVGHSGG